MNHTSRSMLKVDSKLPFFFCFFCFVLPCLPLLIFPSLSVPLYGPSITTTVPPCFLLAVNSSATTSLFFISCSFFLFTLFLFTFLLLFLLFLFCWFDFTMILFDIWLFLKCFQVLHFDAFKDFFVQSLVYLANMYPNCIWLIYVDSSRLQVFLSRLAQSQFKLTLTLLDRKSDVSTVPRLWSTWSLDLMTARTMIPKSHLIYFF